MRRLALAAVLASAVVAVLSGCGGSAAPTPLVVDTDLSSDDIVALAYVARDPHLRLTAVTVSGTGLVGCPAGARHAGALLSALGRGDVPVACGATVPRRGGNVVPADWRRWADRMFGLSLPPAATAPRRSAVALLREAVERAPKPPVVLELAPMTNLARAFEVEPELAAKLGRVVAMGGAFAVPGNAPGHESAETNLWLDPAAARIVLGSGAPVTLVPLDATNSVPVTTFVGQALRRYHHESAAATIVWDLVLATGMDRGGSYFWDPLAAVAAAHPGLVPTSRRTVAVHPDGRTTWGPSGTPVAVASPVDRGRFERELLTTLLGGKPFRLPPHRVAATIAYDGSRCVYRGAAQLVMGDVVLDSVNRGDTPFQWLAGRLDGTHTLADLRRVAAHVDAHTEPPSWFSVDAAGTTPPHARVTWVAGLPAGTTGSTVIACVASSPPRAWVAAEVPVFGRG